MNAPQHQNLAAGHWRDFSLMEQLANVGSEVERALSWRSRQAAYGQAAFERSLELLDLTLADPKNVGRLKEVARAREVWVDFFSGANIYGSSEQSWHAYFWPFTYAARLKLTS